MHTMSVRTSCRVSNVCAYVYSGIGYTGTFVKPKGIQQCMRIDDNTRREKTLPRVQPWYNNYQTDANYVSLLPASLQNF